MSEPIVSLIVAMAANTCIGKDNKMPWHLPEDLKRFKKLTLDHPVIMGRKTFESILNYLGKPLPDRDNIIVTRASSLSFGKAEKTYIASSIEDALMQARGLADQTGKRAVFIAGGADIYTQTLNLADRIYLTKIHQDIDGDAFFPKIKDKDWVEMERVDYLDPVPHSFIRLERRS